MPRPGNAYVYTGTHMYGRDCRGVWRPRSNNIAGYIAVCDILIHQLLMLLYAGRSQPCAVAIPIRMVCTLHTHTSMDSTRYIAYAYHGVWHGKCMRDVCACDVYGRPRCGPALSRAHNVVDPHRLRRPYSYVDMESAHAFLFMHTRDLDLYINAHAHRMAAALPHASTRAPTRMEP